MSEVDARSVSIVQACDDPRLFGFPLWEMQRQLLEFVGERVVRIHVWAMGRRASKSTMAAIVMLHQCLLAPGLDGLVRPGERRYSAAVATNLRQARLIVAAARSIVEASPALASLIESASEDEIRFTNGTALAAWPCSSRGGRGWPIHCLVLDESGFFMSDTEGPQVGERVWQALIPSTAQFGDRAIVIVCSTPYGTDGFFAELWQRAMAGELPDAQAQKLSTASVNPTISDAFLAREQNRDPESFRAEYLAEFVGSGQSYLEAERLEAAIADRGMLPPSAGKDWVAGLDPAFSSDPFGLAIVGRSLDGSGRLVLAQARSWLPRRGVSFEDRRVVEDEVLAEVAAVCKTYRAACVTDQYAAPAVVDRLQRAGLQVKSVAMTATSKTAAFAELRAKLYGGELELYDEPDLIAELRRLRSKFTAGSASVVNPRVGGSHGDMAQALAMAVFDRASRSTVAAAPAQSPSWPGYLSNGPGGFDPSPIDSWQF
jgi:phage terminase large subunit-like protein